MTCQDLQLVLFGNMITNWIISGTNAITYKYDQLQILDKRSKIFNVNGDFCSRFLEGAGLIWAPAMAEAQGYDCILQVYQLPIWIAGPPSKQ